MKKIQIVAVGKIKEKFYIDAVAEYSKRLSRFCRLSIAEVEDERDPKEQNEAHVKKMLSREAASILPRLKNTAVIAMDVNGRKVDSERFAAILRELFEGDRDISFVIGGSYGLAKDVLDAADLSLSMSDMTFPHQLARVMLIEQIFRAFKIIGNEKYHK